MSGSLDSVSSNLDSMFRCLDIVYGCLDILIIYYVSFGIFMLSLIIV